MQGRSRQEPEVLDAEAMAGQMVPEGSVFAFLAEHRRELLPDSFVTDLFPSGTGRASLPADLVGTVLVLQALSDLSDGQAVDALTFGTGKVALRAFADPAVGRPVHAGVLAQADREVVPAPPGVRRGRPDDRPDRVAAGGGASGR
jgi:hypothetical protein